QSETDTVDVVARAQKAYEGCSVNEKSTMKQLLLRLVSVAPGGSRGPGTVLLDELDDPLRAMASRLAEMLVLTVQGSSASFIDRKCIDEWNLLRQWVDEDEEFLLWRQELISQARAWRSSRRDPSALLRDKFLEKAAAWRRKRDFDLTP